MLIRFLLPFWKVLDDQNKLWFTLQLCQQTKDHESPGAGGGQWRWESENIVVWWWWRTLSLSDELHHLFRQVAEFDERQKSHPGQHLLWKHSQHLDQVSMYSVQCTVYSVQCVQCTLYISTRSVWPMSEVKSVFIAFMGYYKSRCKLI